jgi:broad specificity phosphatase PhoE
MERLIVARHAESETGALGLASGEAAGCGGLTVRGREQALALGRALAGEPLELAAVTAFRRAQETAELALAGREVPLLVVPELGDIRVGSYERRPVARYLEWAWATGPEEQAPGGGESRVAAAARFARGYRVLLARPEALILLVAHGLPLRYLLDAAEGRDPGLRAAQVPHAEPVSLAAGAVAAAVERLERWCAAPVFA